jgi:hypothetical protein
VSSAVVYWFMTSMISRTSLSSCTLGSSIASSPVDWPCPLDHP